MRTPPACSAPVSKSTPEACGPNAMNENSSNQEVANLFDDLKKRVEQLGRFL